MDIQHLKLSLMQLMLASDSLEQLQQIKHILQPDTTDWWDELSPEERAEIEEGIAQADRGELLSHQEVMANPKKWL